MEDPEPWTLIRQVAAIRKRTSLLLDVHLVVQNPARYIENVRVVIQLQ